MAGKLADEGWIDVRYPDKEIKRLLKICRAEKPIKSGNVYIQTRHQAVRAMHISLHLSDLNKVTEGRFPAVWTTTNLVRAIDKVFYMGADITRWSVFRILRKSHCWVHFGYPVALSNLLRDIGCTSLDDRTGLPWVKTASMLCDIPEDPGGVLVTQDPADLGSDHKIKLFFGKLDGYKTNILRSTIPTTAHDCFVTVIR